MSRPAWACILCGQGFGRKFSAKRHVDTVHKGYASYVKWSEYLTGRSIGAYPPGEPPKRGEPKHVPTYIERMMDARDEGFYNEMGRIIARQLLTPTSYKLPTFAATTPYVVTPYFGDNIFAVGAYVCSNCLAVKPSTLCYVEGDKGGSSRYRFFCPESAAKSPSEYGETREQFMARAKKYCIDVLVPSVIAWMGNQLELVAVEIEDPNRHDGGAITFLKIDAGKVFSVTLNYSEDKCIKLDPSKTGNWAIRASNNSSGRTALSQSEVSEFLGITETTSYGFFKLPGRKRNENSSRTFLMAVARGGSNANLRLRDDSHGISVTKFSSSSERTSAPDQASKGTNVTAKDITNPQA